MASVIIFFNADKKNKSLYVHDELFLIHFSVQIKQNVYSIGTYSASGVTQIIVKMYGNIAKVTFLKVCHFSIHQHFLDTKTSVVRAVAVEYIRKNRGWHKIAKLVNPDRK